VPLYDYACQDCGEVFEALVLHNSPPAACPRCQGQNLKQQISMFAVDSEATRQSNLAAGRKKYAKVQKDKSMAEAEAIRNHED
jgi:putative FmdB family regulatory protein